VTGPQRGLFARQLRQLRQDKLMSQRDLARASGVPFRTINDLERDLHAPRATTVSNLADALGLTGAVRDSFMKAAQNRHDMRERATAVGGDEGAVGGARAPGAGRQAAMRTLPRGIASFTGRAAELRLLVDAANAVDDEVAIFAIEGMAGIGKTCLAVRAAHQMASRFPDGQLFLDLHGYTPDVRSLSPEAALRSLLRSLGIPHQAIPRALEDAAALYRSVLADTRTLVVLDNASGTAQVAPLLPGTAGCLVIITSRTELRSLDGVRVLHLDAPPEQETIELFCAAAGPGRAEVGDPQVAEIVALCEYLPLAVQIVGARVSRRPALPLGDVLTELRGERDRLSYLEDADRNVTAVFQLSFRNLPGPEQRQMFQRLGLIPGPDFDVGAAASLIGADARTTRQHLESLLGHNLLIQQAAGRYRFHDLVRVYARTLNYPNSKRRVQVPGDSVGDAHLPDEAADVLGRLLDFYVVAAQAADQCLERRIPPLTRPAVVTRPRAVPLLETAEQGKAWISAELANLDAAAQYAVRFLPARVIALASALAQYLSAYGPWPLALALHQGALDAARRLRNVPAQAQALAQLGSVQRRSGDLGPAEDSLQQALDLYRGLSDPLDQAAALLEIGVVRRINGSVAQAAQDLDQALGLYGRQDAALGQAATLAEVGAAQRQEGQFAAAQESLGRALGLYRELGSRPGEAAVLGYLGSVQLTTGELGSAEKSLTSALNLNRELDEPIGQANNLMLLGIVFRDLGKVGQAEEALDDAMRIYAKLGDRRGQAGVQAFLGSLHLLTGHHEQADQCLKQALDLFRELKDRGGEAETLNHSGALALAVGSPPQARARYEQARDLAREIGSLKDEADALEGIGSAWLADAEPSQAVPYLRQALDLYTELGCHADANRVRETLEDLPYQGPGRAE
jgi:tetratricopeptide (TPR) repeat protein/DNA-binding XRE family transcriptional regulator